MRAVYYEAFGASDVLKLGELPTPKAGPGEVLIAIGAASINPIDWKIREGQFECVFDYEFPIIPGWDAAGEIAELGEGVTDFATGEKVYTYFRKPAVHDGTYAEYAAVPADSVARMPKDISVEAAAAVPICALTAWQSLVGFGDVKAGQKLLVHAGAGGVGSFTIPLAKHLGAEVFTTCSTANAEYCHTLGADHVIDYRSQDYRAVIHDLVPEGLDMVFDGVGGTIPTESLDLIRPGGAVVCLNEPPDEDRASAKDIRTLRIYAAPNGGELAEIAGLIEAGVFKLPPVHSFPLAEAAAAMDQSQAGHVRGKLVLTTS